MPFKRKARFLFVSPHGRFRAPVAAALANEIGASVCEARWTSPYPGPLAGCALELLAARQATPPQGFRVDLNEDALRWADTVFVLESAYQEVTFEVPVGTQLRRYNIPECVSADECAEVLGAIEARIRGIIGGLQMLDGPPPANRS